jgi:SAM-dependent methyltransferase
MIFDLYAEEYDAWYDRHRDLYLSELEAVKLAKCRGGVELGVGTGRFAKPLGLYAGLDPSAAMLKLAPRELDLVQGVGEAAPFRDGAYPCALVVVTLCFVKDPAGLLREAARVAKRVAVCIVPRDSPWGRRYRELAAAGHRFYSAAKFYTVAEVVQMLKDVGVDAAEIYATLSSPPTEAAYEPPAHVTAAEAERYGFVCVAGDVYKRRSLATYVSGGGV